MRRALIIDLHLISWCLASNKATCAFIFLCSSRDSGHARSYHRPHGEGHSQRQSVPHACAGWGRQAALHGLPEGPGQANLLPSLRQTSPPLLCHLPYNHPGIHCEYVLCYLYYTHTWKFIFHNIPKTQGNPTQCLLRHSLLNENYRRQNYQKCLSLEN